MTDTDTEQLTRDSNTNLDNKTQSTKQDQKGQLLDETNRQDETGWVKFLDARQSFLGLPVDGR